MSLVLDLTVALVLAGLATLAAIATATGGAAEGAAALASASSGLVLLPLLHLATVTPLLVRSDLAERRLPNLATVSGAGVVAAVSFALLGDHDRGQEALLALVAQTLVLGVGTLAALTGIVGMGDVKLATLLVGASVLVSPGATVSAAMVASVVGGAVGLRLRRRRAPRPTIAYGVVLLVGFWASIAATAAKP